MRKVDGDKNNFFHIIFKRMNAKKERKKMNDRYIWGTGIVNIIPKYQKTIFVY